MKFANFVYVCITHRKLIPCVSCIIKRYKICKLHILQHFTTKLCNFTKFKMVFIAVVMNFTFSKFFKILSITQSVYYRLIQELLSIGLPNTGKCVWTGMHSHDLATLEACTRALPLQPMHQRLVKFWWSGLKMLIAIFQVGIVL